MALAVWFCGCAGASDVPSDWKEIGASDRFTCMVPPYLDKTPARGIDSYAELHEGRGMRVSFDYGMYSSGPPSGAGVQRSTEIIGGKTATVSRWSHPDLPGGFNHVANVCFENVGKDGNRLSLSVSYKNEQESDTALMIIRSIRF